MSKLKEYKELIHELAELLDKSTLSEIEVQEDDFRIRVAREITNTVNYAAPAYPAQPAQQMAAPTHVPDVSAAVIADHPGAIPAPMVGTAYAAPSPESPNFIKVGDMVKEGDTLLIIEAMKVMNQIASSKSGKVKEVFFSDGQPVEYGEILCIIE
ncbi:acetyl-CoA carboxylase biotin carboxyl carrier protein [Kordiimonas pumila]|uniref:Biotin carboxyl carrier protein of acetyl-CoA carboxylase n=1 Tax=Kordiimonas pumila TaxID=2161677 RepID=A0ABV7D1A4_9PROT|nr:acetyl-CoA carboxylase biotin carboxyl carrier protein [Kordiimonas pumila]